jgi:hypothetical protein
MSKKSLMFALLTLVSFPDATNADRCGVDASYAGVKQIEKNKYLFAFDVNSRDCIRYARTGYVNFLISHHYKDQNVV